MFPGGVILNQRILLQILPSNRFLCGLSGEKQENIKRLTDKVIESYKTSLKALEHNDLSLAERVIKLEDEIDLMEHQMRIKHSKERDGECDSYSGTIYVEMLKDLERIGDHANNIVDNILDKE